MSSNPQDKLEKQKEKARAIRKAAYEKAKAQRKAFMKSERGQELLAKRREANAKKAERLKAQKSAAKAKLKSSADRKSQDASVSLSKSPCVSQKERDEILKQYVKPALVLLEGGLKS